MFVIEAKEKFIAARPKEYQAPDLSSLEQFVVPNNALVQSGLRPQNLSVAMRIVGGYEAIPGMFPWLANKNRECGATLIHSTQYNIDLVYI